MTQTPNGNHCRTIEELTTRTETSAVARATPVRIGEGWLGLPFDADGNDPQGIALGLQYLPVEAFPFGRGLFAF